MVTHSNITETEALGCPLTIVCRGDANTEGNMADLFDMVGKTSIVTGDPRE